MRRWLWRVLLLPVGLLVLPACGGTNPGGTNDPPQAPSNLVVTPGPGYAHLSWTDNSDNETGFVIYRDSAAAGQLALTQAPAKVGEVGPNVEEFTDGTVTPGASYDYSVVAKGAGGESERAPSASSTAIPVGIGAMVGLVNSPLDPFTALLVLLSIPEDALGAADPTFTVEGPASWNSGNPVAGTVGERSLEEGWLANIYYVPPVPGEYTVTVDTGTEVYEAVATMPAKAHQYPLPTGVTVSEASSTSVTGNWEADAVHRSFLVGILDADTTEVIAGYDRVPGAARSHQLDELALDPGSYLYIVVAYPVDLAGQPILIEDYGYSFQTSEPFVVLESGAACAGSNPVEDAALAQVIEDELGLDGPPTCVNLLDLAGFDATDRGISSLEGLQYAPNLEAAWLGLNEITDLTPLHGLSNLRQLGLSGHELTDQDVAFLANLANLEELALDENEISSIDTFLEIETLRVLALDNNDITDISGIEGLPNLFDLFIGGNPIDDLDPLRGRSLGGLSLWGTDVTREEARSVVESLDEDTLDSLWMSDIGPADMSFLTAFTNMFVLHYAGNGVSELPDLSVFTRLHQLNLERNDLDEASDLDPIIDAFGNTELEEGQEMQLWLEGNFLDLTDPDLLDRIEQLEDLGVTVHTGTQRDTGE